VLDVVAVELLGHLPTDHGARDGAGCHGGESADDTLSGPAPVVQFDTDEGSPSVDGIGHGGDAGDAVVDVDAHLPDPAFAVGADVAGLGEHQGRAAGSPSCEVGDVRLGHRPVGLAVVALHGSRDEPIA
jgi:hypothetical protein